MFSTSISVFFTVCFIGSGFGAEQSSSYEAVVKCIQTGWNALASTLQGKKGHVDKDTEKIEVACAFLRVSSQSHKGRSE